MLSESTQLGSCPKKVSAVTVNGILLCKAAPGPVGSKFDPDLAKTAKEFHSLNDRAASEKDPDWISVHEANRFTE
jgi:hypothetical protein